MTLIEGKIEGAGGGVVVVYGGDGNEADADTLGDVHLFDVTKCSWSRPVNCESAPRA